MNDKLPSFDRAIVFAEVEASNRRFDKFTDEQRKAFREKADRVRVRGTIKKVARKCDLR